MKTKLLPALASLLLLLSASAQDDAASKIKTITEAHQAKLAEFSKKMQAAEPADRRKLYQEEYPDATEAIKSVSTIVKANPKDEASLEGISWMMQNSRGQDVDNDILELLEEHHLNNEKLTTVIPALMYSSSPDVQAFLKTASTKSEVKDVRGLAIFARTVSNEDNPEKADEYTALLEKFIVDHPKLELRGRPLAKHAEGKLFAAKNLRIGMKAPEIVGKDVDGKEMKLSDYAGKIVVIDFWGDW